jgi:HD domain
MGTTEPHGRSNEFRPMSETAVILISAIVALNFLIVPAIGRRARRRGTAEPSPLRHPRVLTTEAYVSILPSRLLVQAARILGAERICLLVRADDGRFIVAASHGMGEELIGGRTTIDGRMLSGAGIATRVRTSSGRAVVLYADADPSMDPRAHGAERLPDDLTALCAAAVEDADPASGFERAVRACAEGLAAADHTEGAVMRRVRLDLVSLATWIGTRLGLDRGGLIELRLAGWLYETATATSRTAVRLEADAPGATLLAGPEPSEIAVQVAHVPGFEVVALIVGLLGERWDGWGGPHRLRGERIPLASRILAACGAVWTLTLRPPHGAAATMESALRCVQAASGTVFDPTVVMALSEELMGEVPPVGALDPAAEWARADALYSVVS